MGSDQRPPGNLVGGAFRLALPLFTPFVVFTAAFTGSPSVQASPIKPELRISTETVSLAIKVKTFSRGQKADATKEIETETKANAEAIVGDTKGTKPEAKAETKADAKEVKSGTKAEDKAETKAEDKEFQAETKAEDKELKAEAKAEEKELKAETKTEDKALKAEDKALKAETKAEDKELKAETKAEDKALKAETKAEEKELKAEAKAEDKELKAEAKVEDKALKAEEKELKAETKAEDKALKAEEKETGKGNAPAQAKASALTGGQTAVSQIQNMVERNIEPNDGANFNGALSGVYQYNFRDGLSLFKLSGISHERHDGFTVTTPTGSYNGASFDSWTYGLTAGASWDASNAFGLEPNTIVFGGFGNLSTSHLEVGGGSEPLIGDGTARSVGLGGYTLYNSRPFYMLGIASHSWGHADINDARGKADISPNSTGYVVSGNIGTLLPAGPGALDLRLGATFANGQIDDYRDATGTSYTDTQLSETGGSASAKLLFTEDLQWATLKPFVQAGVTQRFDQSNEVFVDGVPYRFHDDDLGVFGRVGVDVSLGDSVQSYIAVRGEKSSDQRGDCCASRLYSEAGLSIPREQISLLPVQ